jgi:hypothetical protein
MVEAIAVLVRRFEQSGSQERDIRRRTNLGNYWASRVRGAGMKSIITQAGKFPVKQVSVHHSNETVPLDKPRTGVLHTTEGHWQDGFNILSSHYSPHFMLGYRDGN